MSNVRRKGHNIELLYRGMFKAMGFDCETSRYASRKHDDCKIDLVGLPFNLQIKAGLQRGLNPAKVLTEMEDAISKKFHSNDKERNYYNFVIWHKQGKQGRERTHKDSLVYSFMPISDTSICIFQKRSKRNKFLINRNMWCMTFADFVQHIIPKLNY